MRYREHLFAAVCLVAVNCSSEGGVTGDESTFADDDLGQQEPAERSSAGLASPQGVTGVAACGAVTSAAAVTVATAPAADEYALTLEASSASNTSWGQKGNEAVILEVYRNTSLLAHLVLHQGATPFTYGAQLGALAAGDTISVRVSNLSAASAIPEACVGGVSLTAAAALGAAGEGLKHAPVFKWPVAKRFNDLPVVLGWSKAKAHYEAVYTNEDGGTPANCGGGAKGMQAEIARWGRGFDIEGLYDYAGTPKWQRCTGSTSATSGAPRMEAAHPVLYYGDGHNRLFESRGGYGNTCGSGSDAKANGDLDGWNVNNPGNAAAQDGPFTITVRPLPVDLDALGFASESGRREGVVDTYAPWLYRITGHELSREGKVDGSRTLPMDRYLYLDVRAADIGGSGDQYCTFLGVDSGYKVRVKTAAGVTLSGPQMTSTYAGSQGWKRIALPLDRVYSANDLTQLIFDAYDDDGIYFLELGDAFIPKAAGPNNATLDYAHKGRQTVNVYVDDNNGGCSNGVNDDGPGGLAYPCKGSLYTMPL
jgi:hypothetical protein